MVVIKDTEVDVEGPMVAVEGAENGVAGDVFIAVRFRDIVMVTTGLLYREANQYRNSWLQAY